MYLISYAIQQGFPFFTWYQRGFLPQPSPLLLPPAPPPTVSASPSPGDSRGRHPKAQPPATSSLAVGSCARALLGRHCSPKPPGHCPIALPRQHKAGAAPLPPHPELSDMSSISHSSRLPWPEPCLQFVGTSNAPGSRAWPLRPLLCLAWWSRTPPVFPSEQPHYSDSRAAADDESPPPYPGLLQPRLHSKAAAVGLGASRPLLDFTSLGDLRVTPSCAHQGASVQPNSAPLTPLPPRAPRRAPDLRPGPAAGDLAGVQASFLFLGLVQPSPAPWRRGCPARLSPVPASSPVQPLVIALTTS